MKQLLRDFNQVTSILGNNQLLHILLELGEDSMDVKTLHRLWSMILDDSPGNITNLSDEALVSSLYHQIDNTVYLSLEDKSYVLSYLNTRKSLIRELLQ